MAYCIFVERATGRQVEWSDEYCEWWYTPGGGVSVPIGPVDLVEVVPAGEPRPVTYQTYGEDGMLSDETTTDPAYESGALGRHWRTPIEPYADQWPEAVA